MSAQTRGWTLKNGLLQCKYVYRTFEIHMFHKNWFEANMNNELFSRSGNYLISTNDLLNGKFRKNKCYTGKAHNGLKPLRKRFDEHVKEKPWWEFALIISAPHETECLNASQIAYVEAELITRLKARGMSDQKDETKNLRGIDELQMEMMEQVLNFFIHALEELCATQFANFEMIVEDQNANVEVKTENSSQTMHVFAANGAGALVEFIDQRHFKLLAGQGACLPPNETFPYFQLHDELRSNGSLVKVGNLFEIRKDIVLDQSKVFAFIKGRAVGSVDTQPFKDVGWVTKKPRRSANDLELVESSR